MTTGAHPALRMPAKSERCLFLMALMLLSAPVTLSLAGDSIALNFAPMAVNSYSSPPSGLSGAQVYDPARNFVGTVQSVEAARDGHPTGIRVTRPDRTGFYVPADHASYDEPNRQVVVDLQQPTGR